MDDILEHFGFFVGMPFRESFTQASAAPQVEQKSPEDLAAERLFKLLERDPATMGEENRQAALDLVKQANLAAKNPRWGHFAGLCNPQKA